MKLNFFTKKNQSTNTALQRKTMPKLVSGFTLVELMVSVSLFVVVMVISMGAILTVFDSSKKSQTLRSVMDNLNFTLETMTRTIRFGTNYHCDASVGDITTPAPRDCALGAPSLVVKDFDGNVVAYRLSGGRITRSINGGLAYFITSGDVTISSLAFRVFGSPPYSSGGDLFQPQVIITIGGYSGLQPTTRTSFSLQTTVSQRLFDSQ